MIKFIQFLLSCSFVMITKFFLCSHEAIAENHNFKMSKSKLKFLVDHVSLYKWSSVSLWKIVKQSFWHYYSEEDMDGVKVVFRNGFTIVRRWSRCKQENTHDHVLANTETQQPFMKGVHSSPGSDIVYCLWITSLIYQVDQHCFFLFIAHRHLSKWYIVLSMPCW